MKFMSKWTHEKCKSVEVQRRKRESGPPSELELVMPENAPTEYVGRRGYSRARNGGLVHRSRR